MQKKTHDLIEQYICSQKPVIATQEVLDWQINMWPYVYQIIEENVPCTPEALFKINDLLLLGVPIESQDLGTYRLISLLHKAVTNQDIVLMKLLLQFYPKTTLTTIREMTALQLACQVNNVEISKVLLDWGEDPNARNSHGDTPLTFALENKNNLLFKLLLDNKVDTTTTIKGLPLLHYLCSTENMQAINFLLEASHFDSSSEKNIVPSALEIAMKTGNVELVKLLIAHGIFALSFNKELFGSIPIEHRKEMVALLKKEIKNFLSEYEYH